ncbi:tetratricopeptide repeat protein [Flavobacterium psychrophilum]|uniref:tetratricopeptide repeat protein n=2 Tax=Flavobacterium psychrophilum TaxID=96345 RepID=UPI000B7C09DA|nr:hypothetical protein [Flavobacterium psychrophilum]EKT4501865.1 hypothetical protein [Flavobacterium psychrophilum]MCB5983880.1 hypothetical protein [Flavobacterium psychrophilum]MCB5994727.1 hypothetical protein [Flavobacterium psychrophilum]MCB5996999.1 hypothetical protein [Flavobacterium psychrophilum]MCB6004713.1 hypothetical protein [Flavobacterium psychrophilum]
MRKNIIFAILSVLLISCGSKISYKDQIIQYNNFVSVADSLNKIKDYKQAIVASTEAIKITDTLSQAYLKRGDSNLGLKNYDDAEDDFSDVIKIEGEKSIAYKGRAIAYYFKNEKDDFIDDIDIYITNHSNDIYAHSLRGDYYTEEEDCEKAILDYSICLKNNPRNSIFYLKRGNVYAIDGQNDLSIIDYENYTRLNPNVNNDPIFYKRGLLNIKADNFQKAINDFSLISKSFTNLKIFELRGDCFFALKNYNDAIKNYSLFLASNPNNIDVITKRGDSYFNNNDLKNANSDYKNSASLKWKSKGFFYKYGWYILFVLGYFLIALILENSFKEEYDNKKIKKSYWYYFLTGLFGGHYFYINYVWRYALYTILVLVLFSLNSFNIRSFYNHNDLLWTGIVSTQYSMSLIYVILALFVIDLLILPYSVFSYNHNLRLSINDEISKQREIEINEMAVLLEKQNTKFKSLK